MANSFLRYNGALHSKKNLTIKKALTVYNKAIVDPNEKKKLFYKSWKKYGDRSAHLKYKILRNRFVALLRTVKQKYFKTLTLKNRNLSGEQFVN